MTGSLVLLGSVALLVALAAVAAYWRLKPGSSHGSAGFGTWPGPVAPTQRELPAGLVCGRVADGRYAGWDHEGHWLLIAPTGAGKSTGILAPSLRQWQGSQVTIDVKGELATLCAPALQASGVRCVRIDPFNLLGDASPVARIALDPVAQAAALPEPIDAMRAVAAMLIDAPATGGDAHWSEAAQMVTGGFVTAASCANSAAMRGLRGVAHLASEGHSAVKMLARLRWPEHLEPQIMRTVTMLGEMSANERGAVMSTIRRQLDFLASAPVAATVTGDWDVTELFDAQQPLALFVILPAERLGTQGRLLRVVVGTIAAALIAAGPDHNRRLLFAIDEAASLGRLAAIEQGIALLRGYGAHFMLAFQDSAQIVNTYGEAMANSLAANCHALYWSCRDLHTAKHVSELLGEYTTLSASRDLAHLPLNAEGQSAVRETARRLLTADEIRRLPANVLLAIVSGHRPVQLQLISPAETIAAATPPH